MICHKLKLTYSYACWIMHTRHHQQISKWNAKGWPEKLLILGRSGTHYVAMVTKLLSLYCGAHLVESYCKKTNISDTNCLRYLFSSYLIKIWLSVRGHQLTNMHILKTWISLEWKYLKMVNSIFLVIQTTFLCFKMAYHIRVTKLALSTLSEYL